MLDWSMSDQNYTAHVVIIRGFVSLPCTDDPLKVKKYQVFCVFDLKNDRITNKNHFVGR